MAICQNNTGCLIGRIMGIMFSLCYIFMNLQAMNICYFYNQNVEIEKYKRNKTKNRSPKHMRLLQSSFKAL